MLKRKIPQKSGHLKVEIIVKSLYQSILPVLTLPFFSSLFAVEDFR